jgi:hypothetical protein
MQNAIEHFKANLQIQKKLDKILKDMDPASGVSVSIRRGVSRDNPDVEDDELRRPWVTVETADLEAARVIIEEAAKAARRNVETWRRFLEKDVKDAREILDKNPPAQ